MTIDLPFTHLPGCTGPRDLDITPHEEQGVVTVHCVDCGAHYPTDPPAAATTGALAGERRTWDEGIELLDLTEGRIDRRARNLTNPWPSHAERSN